MQFLQSRTLPGLSSIKVKRLTEEGREFLNSGGLKKDLNPDIHIEIVATKNDKLPDNFRFVMAANPTSDMEGYEETNYQTNDMDKAQISRGVMLALEPDLKSWIEWASDTNSETGKTNIHSHITEFVSVNSNLFHVVNDDFITANPRAWEMVSNAYEVYLEDNDKFIFQMLVAGVAGRDAATTLLAFLRETNDPILKPSDIFNHKYKNVPDHYLEKLKEEPFARKLMTIKGMVSWSAELAKEKEWKKLNKDIHLLAELINALPDDMEISIMTKIESEHPEIHKRLWGMDSYIKSYTSKLSRF